MAVANRTTWRYWVELLGPLVLIASAWLVISTVTTSYITWADRVHQNILGERVTSILAAGEMRHAVWQLEQSNLEPSASAEAVERFLTAWDRAQAATSSADSLAIIQSLHDRFAEFRSSPAMARTSLAKQLIDQCDALDKLNEQAITLQTSTNQAWMQRILWLRFVVTHLSPVVGLYLGYRVARRMHSRIAAIRVSLEGVSDELGVVLVASPEGEEGLEQLNSQVRAVASQIHQVVTQLQTARQEAVRNDRLAAVGQLAAGVAHELRNPLTAVQLLVQSTATRSGKGAWTPEKVQVIQTEIARMERTIQNLLDFARPAATARTRHDLLEPVNRAINLVQGRAHQDHVQIELSTELPRVEVLGDPEQLHQVFVNLLLNGIDAMPGGGLLRVEVRVTEESGSEGAFCHVAVLDEGPGISPEVADKIFEPFVTTKSRGTGLGLAISRRLVEEHSGRLSAANRPGAGAEFVVTLQCAESHATAQR